MMLELAVFEIDSGVQIRDANPSKKKDDFERATEGPAWIRGVIGTLAREQYPNPPGIRSLGLTLKKSVDLTGHLRKWEGIY
jgi:hypothetical protein